MDETEDTVDRPNDVPAALAAVTKAPPNNTHAPSERTPSLSIISFQVNIYISFAIRKLSSHTVHKDIQRMYVCM